MSKRICPKCGNEVPDFEAVCQVCGTLYPQDQLHDTSEETAILVEPTDDESTLVLQDGDEQPYVMGESAPAPQPHVEPQPQHVEPQHQEVPAPQQHVVPQPQNYGGQGPADESPTFDEEPPRRRTNWGLVIPIIVICVALLGGGGYFGYMFFTEKQAWTKIVDSKDYADFQNYLDRYPFGSHRSEAESKFKDLKEEYDEWVKINKKKGFNDFRSFVRNYPDSRFYDEAVERMDSIAWDEATHYDTPDAYATYMQRMPKGKYAHEAMEKADNLKMRELSDYERAMAIDAVSGMFDDMDNNNTDDLLARFPAEFQFMGKAATKVTLLNYVSDLQENASYVNIKASDYKVSKNIDEDRQFTYTVDFNVDYYYGRYSYYSDYYDDDSDNHGQDKTFTSNTGTAVVDDRGMIRSLSIRKVSDK